MHVYASYLNLLYKIYFRNISESMFPHKSVVFLHFFFKCISHHSMVQKFAMDTSTAPVSVLTSSRDKPLSALVTKESLIRETGKMALKRHLTANLQYSCHFNVKLITHCLVKGFDRVGSPPSDHFRKVFFTQYSN